MKLFGVFLCEKSEKHKNCLKGSIIYDIYIYNCIVTIFIVIVIMKNIVMMIINHNN